MYQLLSMNYINLQLNSLDNVWIVEKVVKMNDWDAEEGINEHGEVKRKSTRRATGQKKGAFSG